MAKKKYPSELNTRLIRVSVGDYALLKEVSISSGITIADLVHEVILGNTTKDKSTDSSSPNQIPMAISVIPAQITTRVMPRQVTGNGIAHINPKIIREVKDG